MLKENGESVVELSHDGYISTSLERFLTRLLRRDYITALSKQKHDPEEAYQLDVFGSSVPQLYRPIEGYPVRRLARDVDIGVVMKAPRTRDGFNRPSHDDKNQIGHYLLDAVRGSGAEVVEGTVKNERGYDGFRITKIYTPEQIRKAMKGKSEWKEIIIPDRPVKVPLEISPVFERYPILPLTGYGKSGLYHEHLLEVVGRKLYRMTTPESGAAHGSGSATSFEMRDIMDVFNVIKTGRIDIEKDAEALRLVALVTSAYEPEVQSRTLKNLEPNDANIAKAAKTMGIGEVQMREVFQTVYDAVKKIYPRDRSKLPDSKAGPLGFTLEEFNFYMGLEGIAHLAQGGNAVRIEPTIKANDIVSSALEEKYPGLRRRILDNQLLNNVVKDAKAQNQMRDF